MATTLLHERLAADSVNSLILILSELRKNCKVETMTSSYKLVKYLLKTHGTDDAITEMSSKILQFTQPSHMALTWYAEALGNEELLCSCLFDKYVREGIFIKELHESIRHRMNWYQIPKKNASLHDFVCYDATSLKKLQHGLHPTGNQYSTWNLISQGRKRNNQRQTQELTTFTNDKEGYSPSFLTQSLSMIPLPAMAFKSPSSNDSDPSALSMVASADDAPFPACVLT